MSNLLEGVQTEINTAEWGPFQPTPSCLPGKGNESNENNTSAFAQSKKKPTSTSKQDRSNLLPALRFTDGN